MKKSNSILQAAVVAALLTMAAGVQAAVTAPVAPVVFASEIFGVGSSATVIVNAANAMDVTFALGAARGTGVMQVTFTLAGGAQFAVAAPATLTLAGGTFAGTSAIRSGGAVGDSVVVYDVTVTTAGAASNTITFATPNLKNAQGLATVGSLVGVTVGLSDQFGAFDTSGAHSVNIATSAASLSKAITANTDTGTSPASGTIDAIAQASKFFKDGVNVGSKTVNLGTIAFTDVAAKQKDGTNARVRTGTDLIAISATGNFAAALSTTPALSGVYLSTAASCTTVAAINATTLTATTATFAAVAGTTTKTNLCMTVDGVTAIAATTIAASATYTPAITTEVVSSVASTNLMPLVLNVTQNDVRSYIPAAAVGYQSYIRVINNGSVAAPITGQFIYADGTTSAEGQLISSLAAGGAVTLTAAEVEATTVGAPVGGAAVRPRLRVSAPTNKLEVQSFMSSPSGVFTDMTGAQ